ncbi:MAG TPA: LytTR family DNA-binding domain-containing protein [Chitinophagaceae bacterium]|nr:LytTR family DNA-binding domain-containing protein [Chitinophagaceae bacterium]
MLNCIAIDDESLALELLEDNISKVPFLKLVGGCSNVSEAMKILQQQPVDLIFIDIQMPGMTGLQFIQSLIQRPMVILVTAYEKFALEGFNLDVIDYLVKPVPLDRFIRACNKAWDFYQLKTVHRETQTKPDYLFVNVEYSMLKVVISTISWVEGLKDYIKIHLDNTTKPVITRMSMKAMEEQLPTPEFFRIHKSFIVSVAHITAVRKNSVFIGQMELPVGEIYRKVVQELLRRPEER